MKFRIQNAGHFVVIALGIAAFIAYYLEHSNADRLTPIGDSKGDVAELSGLEATDTDGTNAAIAVNKKKNSTLSSSSESATIEVAAAAANYHKKYGDLLYSPHRESRRKDLVLAAASDPAQVSIAIETLTDKRFGERNFASDPINARIFSVKVLGELASQGHFSEIESSISNIGSKLSKGGAENLYSTSHQDLISLLIPYIEARGLDEFKQNLDDYLHELSLDEGVYKHVRRSVFFAYYDRIDEKEYSRYFAKLYGKSRENK